MDHSIKLNGTTAGVELIVDGGVAAIFTREKAIDALSFYNALGYHAGDTYELEEGSCGDIPEGSFDSLEGLVKEIIEGINGLATEKSSTDDGSNTASQSNDMNEEMTPADNR